MIIKVFYGELPILLTDEEIDINNYPKAVWIKEFSKDAYLSGIAGLQQGLIDSLIIETSNIQSLLSDIRSQYQIIEAAGGIITNANDEVLMIFRRGKWDLPKGKIEPKESIEMAAEREIKEETGVGNLTLRSELKETYHIYKEKEIEILKISYWFHFSIDDTPILIPQIEEDITAIRWFAKNALAIPLGNTYESIKYLFGDWLVS